MHTKKSKNQELHNNIFFIKNQMNLSKKYYQDIITYDLILKKNYTSIMQLSRIEKIILNTSSKNYITDKKDILFTLAALELLSGQKPQLTYARKSIANFKIRQDQIIGCKVTLHQKLMYTFLDKLSKIIFPRLRDHSKNKTFVQNIKKKSMFNKFSAYSIGFQNMMIFPELENHYDLVDYFRGMNLTFIFSNSNKKTTLMLLSAFQLPFFFKT